MLLAIFCQNFFSISFHSQKYSLSFFCIALGPFIKFCLRKLLQNIIQLQRQHIMTYGQLLILKKFIIILYKKYCNIVTDYNATYRKRQNIWENTQTILAKKWWCSSGQRARFQLRRSEFDSHFSLQFFCKVAVEKNENKQKEAADLQLKKGFL